MYDYEIDITKAGKEKSISKESYDSVDSYASTFLKAVSDYVYVTEDTKWLAKNTPDLQIIFDALLRCMDTQGITFAKADYPIYYLMDNCETNAGLRATGKLQKLGTGFSQSDEVKSYFVKNSEAITKKFWRNGEYVIGIDDDGKALFANDQFSVYPKTIAQIYPIAWGILDGKEKRAEEIYEKICKDFQWQKMDYRDQESSKSCWPIFAFVGALMGDEERVETYVNNYIEVVNEDHGYPIHIDDSAWMIKTCEEMKTYYHKKLFTLF